MYGIVGMHVLPLDMGKKFQLFLVPGVLIVMQRNQFGAMQTHLAYTWGGSLKLEDFHLPFFAAKGKNATLYLNIVKCFAQGMGPLGGGQTNMAGFSISPSKNYK